ncbi:MAG: exo-alpha-sialidase [Clostridia bacterium]|nr:exo-alpha-sialidase [Clostridia bacterium]
MNVVVKETKVICANPDNPWHNYFAWPSVARLHDGKLAMVASGFRIKHICPFGKVVMCLSEDEGQTWTRPSVVMDTPLDDRDAGILTFGTQDVLVTSFNNTVAQQKIWNTAKDEKTGKTRPKSRYIDAYLNTVNAEEAEARYLGSTFVISRDNGKTFGPVMRIPVSAPHGPTKMKDGTILYVGRTFSDNDKVKPGDGVHAYILHSDGTYEKRGEIANIRPDVLSCEPHTIVLPDGKIIVHIRVQGAGVFTIYQSESVDGGRTFTIPHPLLESKGGAPAHLLRLRNGTLISVYGYRNPPYGIRMMYSTDNGANWSTGHELYINEVSPDLGYPASVELANGDILTVFYAKEQEPGPAVIMQTVWRLNA